MFMEHGLTGNSNWEADWIGMTEQMALEWMPEGSAVGVAYALAAP